MQLLLQEIQALLGRSKGTFLIWIDIYHETDCSAEVIEDHNFLG